MFICPECGATYQDGGHCGDDGTALAHVGDDALIGTTIGPYRIARLLGVGGMGRVYKAVQPAIGSRVAIKVLSRECAEQREHIERFFAEARAVNLIRHESIVNVLDLAALPDGRPYIIMEYLDGAPLSHVIAAAQTSGIPLPLGGVARLAVEVLDALAAAHAKGIVHRDLKPDNIFVTPAGRAKVLDFGIAKLIPELGGSSTQTGSLLGTPHYMAPEQAAGRSVDFRADLYAIGLILFECATGRRPFSGESLFEVLRQHIDVPPPQPSALRPELSPAFEHVIMTALAKDPNYRFASAEAMAGALQQATVQLPPDQWTAITASIALGTVSRSLGTPSWGALAHVGGNTATVAGQMTVGPTTKSRTVIWASIGGVVAVGAAVAIGIGSHRAAGPSTGAVAAGGGSDTAASTTPASPRATNPGPGAPSPAAPAPTPVVLTPAPAAPAPPPAAPAPAPSRPTAGSGSQDASDHQSTTKTPTVTAAPTPTTMSGQSPAGPPPTPGPGAPVGSNSTADQSPPVVSPPPAEANAAAGTAPSSQPLVTFEADGWFKRLDIPGPPGFNPKHIDVAAFIAFANRTAHAVYPDAQLIRVEADAVYPDGHANITLYPNADVELRYIVPSRMKRDANKPIGVPQKSMCQFYVEAETDGVSLIPTELDCDKEHPIAAPRCSPAGVWKYAVSRGAAGGNAVATLSYRAFLTNPPIWYFDIGDPSHSVFSQSWSDEVCRSR